MLPGSEPAPGSVSPKQPTSSPLASLGRYFRRRSEEHTSELQSLMRISYAVFCLKKKNITQYSLVVFIVRSFNMLEYHIYLTHFISFSVYMFLTFLNLSSSSLL